LYRYATCPAKYYLTSMCPTVGLYKLHPVDP
jgi:hypothetical protein